jgi:tetratricopeptide (TPR) repeat protein
MNPQLEDDESIRHLVELGYVDPAEVAARTAASRRRNQDGLQQAIDLDRQSRRPEAVAVLERLACEDAEWIAPHQLLAELYYQTGRNRDAQAQIDWLTCHGVESPRLALIAGGLALARREFAAAIEVLSYAGQVEPGLPGVHTYLGTALLKLGQLEFAEEVFQSAIAQKPADAHALDGLAAIALQRHANEEAADWALQALAQDMRLARAHFHLGMALLRLDRPEEALRALEAGAKIDPARAAFYRWLAWVAENHLSDSERAVSYRERGHEIVRRRRQRTGM